MIPFSIGIDDSASFVGRVNGVDGILRHCQVAFHPSMGEVGYSLSILEYMRAGLPVVVSNNTSVCEATTDSIDGLIYPQGDIDAAAKALMVLITDPELASSMGKSGSAKVANCFSLDNCHLALTEAIDSIIRNHISA